MEIMMKQNEQNEVLEGYRMLVEATGQGLWSWDLINNHIYYTKQWKRQIGYKLNEIKNELNTLKELLHPDDCDRYFNEIETYLQHPEGSFKTEFRLRQKNGSYIWICNHTIAKKNKEGKVLKLYGLDMDITYKKEATLQLKKSEAKYRLLFEQSPIEISCSNSDEHIVPNKALSRITGYTITELKNKNWREVTFPEDIKKIEIILQSLLNGSRKTATFKKRLIHKNGNFIWAEINVKLHKDEHNTPVIYIATVKDITGQVAAEKMIKEKNNALRNINANKNKLFSIISHDLRSPISSISGVLDMVYCNYHDFNDEEKREIIKSCVDSVNNTQKLIETLLDWARSQSGTIEVKPEEFHFVEAVEKVIGTVAQSAEEKNIMLKINIPGDLQLVADKNMINTVLRNLLTNSIKFTSRGGKINIKHVKTENGFARICIEDNGTGIDKENISKIFDVGAGYTTAGTENEKGTGLGLILCKEFIQKNDGVIWIKSRKGRGTRVFFTLPALTFDECQTNKEETKNVEMMDVLEIPE